MSDRTDQPTVEMATPDPEPQQRIGRYEVIRPLGIGGMAEVFLTRVRAEAGFERLAALKRLQSHLVEDESMVEMFIDEARITATLNHANIAQVYEFGKADDSFFIALEYVDGPSLATVVRRALRQEVPIPPAAAAYVVAAICAGADYAHAKTDEQGQPLHIIHRDINPNNVLVSFAGEVKLIDFGVARAKRRIHQTIGPKIKGSFAYMSPEQASARPIDQRSDIFSIGTVLYVLLTGQNPFVGTSDVHTLERVQRGDFTPPSMHAGVPRELEAVCMRAMAKSADERFDTAGEMQEALDQYCHRHQFGSRQFGRWLRELLDDGAPSSSSPGRKRRRSSRSAKRATALVEEGQQRVAEAGAAAPDTAIAPIDRAPDGPSATRELDPARRRRRAAEHVRMAAEVRAAAPTVYERETALRVRTAPGDSAGDALLRSRVPILIAAAAGIVLLGFAGAWLWHRGSTNDNVVSAAEAVDAARVSPISQRSAGLEAAASSDMAPRSARVHAADPPSPPAPAMPADAGVQAAIDETSDGGSPYVIPYSADAAVRGERPVSARSRLRRPRRRRPVRRTGGPVRQRRAKKRTRLGDKGAGW